MQNIAVVLGYAAGLIVAIFAIRILAKPLRILLRATIKTLVGGAVLILINTFSGSLGISLGVNLFTAFITGVLGLPGLALLITVRQFFL